MKKRILIAALLGSNVLLGYSAIRIIKSVDSLNHTFKRINFSEIRKELNHLIDNVRIRKHNV